jgi:hypothetical protein
MGEKRGGNFNLGRLSSIVAVSLLTCLNTTRYFSTFLAKFNRYNSKHTRRSCDARAVSDTKYSNW